MSSKFKSLFDATREQPEAPVVPPLPPVREMDSTADGATAKRRGRPVGGKRSDQAYVQVTAYIRKDIHRRVKIALLQEQEKQEQEKIEFSQLVDRLLADWLETKQ